MFSAMKTGIEEIMGTGLGKLPIVPRGPVGDIVTDMTSSNAMNAISNSDKSE
jgi:hypothetical protein